MKKLLCLITIFLMLISCSKEISERKENQIFNNKTEARGRVNKLNLDSVARMNAGAFLASNITQSELDSIIKINLIKSTKSITTTTDTIEHYTVSNYIHFVIVEKTTYPTRASNPSLSVGVPSGYVLVGGGAHAFDNTSSAPITGAGAFLTESRPNGSLTLWKGRSKDHMVADAHYLSVYAIGMKIDGVTSAYLRSQISLDSTVSSTANHPTAQKSVPAGYLLIGGGAYDHYTGYGNMLVKSYPKNSTTWSVEGKDHRRADACTITAYAIGINNISFANVGYLETEYIWEDNYVPYGYNLAETYLADNWGLTCPGGRTKYYNIGRMLISVRPDIPSWGTYDVSTWSSDNYYMDNGSDTAWAVRLR
jgi:hypothetical protein